MPDSPHTSLSRSDAPALTALLVDQQSRWQQGKGVLVEAILDEQPVLRGDDEAVLHLILHEVLLRSEAGEGVALAEYQQRFPHLAEQLALQFEVEQALAGETVIPATDLHEGAGMRLTVAAGIAARPSVAGYEILGVLGQGAMGVVYRARQQKLGRIVALKMIQPHSAGLPEYLTALLERLRSEAAALARLQHPDIVQIFELGESDGLPFLALEYVAGGSLARKLAGMPQPAQQAAALVERLARAMHAAHGCGVLHRDLKPDNILLTLEGGPKISDFGLAKRLDGAAGLTASGMLLGTPSYMAPEQAEGKNQEVGVAADVYALGAVLYEVLTGRPPFRAATPVETLLQVKMDEPAPPRQLNAEIPRDLETIVLKCLHKQPHRRYATAEELAEDLRRWQSGEPIRARRVGTLERAWRWCARQPARAGLAAALVVLAVSLLAGGWRLWQQHAATVARREQADEQTRGALARVRERLEQAWLADDAAGLAEVAARAERAVERARDSDAGAEVREEAEQMHEEVQARLAQAEKNRTLTTTLLDMAEPRESSVSRTDEVRRMLSLARPNAEKQFTAAFRLWGLDVDRTPVAEAVTRLRALPPPVIQQVVAGLDTWAQDRRDRRSPGDWQRLHELADRLDNHARRREIRRIQASSQPNVVRRLRELAASLAATREPVLGVVTLSRALEVAKETRLAEQVLEAALAARPGEVILLAALGRMLDRQGPARLGEAIECYQAIRARRPKLGIALASALVDADRMTRAEAVLRDLVRRHPDNPQMHFLLGDILRMQNKMKEAETAFRQTVHLRPDHPGAYSNLGYVLHAQKKVAEAEAAYRQAIHFHPTDFVGYFFLGTLLAQQQKLEEAATAYRQAIRCNPKTHVAYNNLGNVLRGQKKLDEAVTSYQKAILNDPKRPRAHYNLGMVLHDQKKLSDAAAAFRQAIHLAPDHAEAYFHLSVVLQEQKKLDDAETACRQAIRVRPNYVDAHIRLGIVLAEQKKLDAAATAFRGALRLQPDNAAVLYNLGNLLSEQKKFDEAESAYRQVIKLRPNFHAPHWNLAGILLNQERFKDALDVLTKPGAMPPVNHPRRRAIEGTVHFVRRQVVLDGRLPAVLAGTDKPADATELLEFARLCAFKKLPAAAERFYRQAFAAEAKHAEDVPAGHRYNAACSAALAGCAQGKDAARLDDTERARLRKQALDWLRRDLAFWGKAVDRADTRNRVAIGQQMGRWQGDDALAGVRDREGLAKLPKDEREQWQQLWADVAALREEAERKGDPSPKR
jgi:serine/threonine-protein kinase